VRHSPPPFGQVNPEKVTILQQSFTCLLSGSFDVISHRNDQPLPAAAPSSRSELAFGTRRGFLASALLGTAGLISAPLAGWARNALQPFRLRVKPGSFPSRPGLERRLRRLRLSSPAEAFKLASRHCELEVTL